MRLVTFRKEKKIDDYTAKQNENSFRHFNGQNSITQIQALKHKCANTIYCSKLSCLYYIIFNSKHYLQYTSLLMIISKVVKYI